MSNDLIASVTLRGLKVSSLEHLTLSVAQNIWSSFFIRFSNITVVGNSQIMETKKMVDIQNIKNHDKILIKYNNKIRAYTTLKMKCC